MGPNIYATCINFLQNCIQWHLSLIKSIFFSIDIHFQYGRLDYEDKYMYYISILYLLHTNWATALCCDWRLVQGGFLLATPYIPSNIAHGIVIISCSKLVLRLKHRLIILSLDQVEWRLQELTWEDKIQIRALSRQGHSLNLMEF